MEMKRILSLILIILLASAAMTDFSAESVTAEITEPYKASFVFSDGFTPITKSTIGEKSELISFLGLTQEQMGSYFDDRGFLVFAISEDYREQIYVIAEQNDISSAIVNLSDIENPSSVQSLLIGDAEYDGAQISVTEPIDGNTYFYVTKTPAPPAEGEEASGETAMIYYVTVVDSVAYVVCYSSETGEISTDAKLMMSGFVNSMKLGEGPQVMNEEKQNFVQIVVNWILIAAAAGIIIYAVISIVSEFRRRRLEEDFHDKTPRRPIR